jgi:hypothetical protein
MGQVIVGIVFIFVIAILMSAGTGSGRSNEDYSLDNHRLYGKYRVLYDDGYLSQPFMGKTAKYYAEHFGGRIVSRNYNGPHKTLGSRKGNLK